MLVHAPNAEKAGSVPEANGSFVGPSCVEIGRVVGNLSGLVWETSLVDDVALTFPLPDYQLSELLDAQSQPGARRIDCNCADFVLSD